MGLKDYEPKEGEKSESERVDFKKVLKIMRCIANKKCSYPGEIVNYTGLNRDQINFILFELLDEGVLERLQPSFERNDPRLLSRRMELRNNGITSIQQVRSMKWFALNSSHSWRLKVAGRPLYVDEFHRPLDDDVEPMGKGVDGLKSFVSDRLEVV